MEKTRTNDYQHKCSYCGDLFFPSKHYLWQCSDYCRLMVSFEKVGDCWVCRRKNKNRYGTFNYKMRAMGSHRASYIIFKGEIPLGMDICHTCDNRQCINPDHLFLGTRQENMIDCMLKGRMSVGGKHYCTKLTEENVREIRKLREERKTYVEIADQFGIAQESVYDICKRRTWRHVE